MRKPKSKTREYEKAIAAVPRKYLLRLYISGTTPRSVRAIENIKRLCDTRLKGCYELEIVDIYQQPASLATDQIIAVPTLIKTLPLPMRKLIGDLSDEENVLMGLDLVKTSGAA